MKFYILTAILLIIGCSSPPKTIYVDKIKEIPVPVNVAVYPDYKLVKEAPVLANTKCASLSPTNLSAGSSSSSAYATEIAKARSAYSDCANRHNALVDFYKRMSESYLDIINYYKQQLRK